MRDTLIRSIVVAGGGLAGWMAAAVLARALRGRSSVELIDCKPGYVEPETISLPQLAELHAILGIDETDLVRKTRATFRLGGEFTDWGGKGTRFFIPIGELGPRLEAIPFLHYWLKLRSLGDQFDIADYSLCAVGARANRFTKPASDPRSVLSTLAYAHQLDTALYADYLRTIALAHGVVRREGHIAAVERCGPEGSVAAVILEGGERRTAELFVDCTEGRLIADATVVEDWARWLPCDSIVTVSSAPSTALPPYALATAADAGWKWQIMLQHRTGHGYVYSSRHISDQEATTSLMAGLGNGPLEEPHLVRFANHRRDRLWAGNVVAIGPAAAVLDPLEGAGLRIAQVGIMRLLTLFPDRTIAASERGEYNRLMINEIERVRDFLIAHYATSARRDTPFWRHCAELEPPETLEHKLKLFRSRGRVVLQDEETFTEHHWAALLLGQGIVPERHDPLIDSQDVEQMKMQCRRIRSVIRQGADSMPLHSQIVAKSFPTGPQ